MIPPIPAPILSTSRDPNNARLRVSTATRQAVQIARGKFFVGSSERLGVPILNVHDSVLKAAPDKLLVLEDALIELDFASSADGQFSISLGGYVDISNGNAWSYTPGSPGPVGRPLSAGLVNALPTSTAEIGVIVSGFSGVADYPFFFADHYLETVGARESISRTDTNFFDKGRQIVLLPGQELLIRTQTGGDAAGTVDIRTVFFTSEIDPEDAPSVLGATLAELGYIV